MSFVRWRSATASGTSLPAAMWPATAPGVIQPTLTWPPSVSLTTGATPRYGACAMATPASLLKSSPAICIGEPAPGVP
ncbi:hypothetical protein D9M69_680470 [compost metagenome]